MSFVSDLVLRYSLSRRQQAFTRIVAWVSMLGMVLGVASLITVMSVMNGFSAELHSRILAVIPHGKIHPQQGQMSDWPSLATQVLAQPHIVGVAPYIEDTVLFQAWGRHRGARMTGIDLSAQPAVNTVDQHIVRGNWDALAEQRFSVALGSTLARILGVTVGDEVEVLLPRLTVTPLGIFPRVKRLVVVAEFEVGADPDASQSYVSLDTARRLLGRGEVDGLQIKVDELFAAPEITAALKQALPADLIVTDWRSSQGSLFTAVQMEKITVGLLLLSVVAVAAFNIVSTLTMSVTEKRTDIAVLRVLGASSRSILLVFIGYGMLLGVMGVVLGAMLGVTLALHISEFATLVEQITGVSLFDPTVYYIGRLPSVLIWSDVFITVAAGLVLSFVATLYPAWRAAQISPVEVLNHG